MSITVLINDGGKAAHVAYLNFMTFFVIIVKQMTLRSKYYFRSKSVSVGCYKRP